MRLLPSNSVVQPAAEALAWPAASYDHCSAPIPRIKAPMAIADVRFIFVTSRSFAKVLRFRDIDCDPYGRYFPRILGPMRGSAAFGEAVPRIRYKIRFTFLVISHLTLKEVCNRRPVDMLRHCVSMLNDGSENHQWRTDRGGYGRLDCGARTRN